MIIVNTLGQGVANEVESNELHFLHKKITDPSMKLEGEGGFSSKLRIESLIELSNEVRTHRPSLSSSTKIETINL